MNKKYNILFLARDDGGCGFFRCVQPSNFLVRAGLAESRSILQKPTPEELMNADLVVIQDTGSAESSSLINFMVLHKIPFVTEFDDFIHHVSPNNHAGYMAWNPSTLFVHRAMEAARKGIGMTVSTNQLAREFFPYNNRIYVVPNFLDKEKWDNPILKRNDGKIRIGWCGGNAHADDLKMISKVLDKIVKEYKGKVIFETMGMTRQELHGVFPMKVQHEECISCGYEGELHHHPGESLDNYPLVLASKGWDLAVAPVINNAFGNAKSDLKIKEYSAAGIPIIASPIVPYIEAVDKGASVIFAETFEEWYNALKALIDNEASRQEIVKKNKAWMEKNWIQDNILNIYEVYKQIISLHEAAYGPKQSRLKNNNLI